MSKSIQARAVMASRALKLATGVNELRLDGWSGTCQRARRRYEHGSRLVEGCLLLQPASSLFFHTLGRSDEV